MPNAVAFAVGRFPDLAKDQDPPAGDLAQGMALRSAMKELGEDVSKFTFK
jgi:hypothetical protein